MQKYVCHLNMWKINTQKWRFEHKDLSCQKCILKGRLVKRDESDGIEIVTFTLKIRSYRFKSLNAVASFKIVATSAVINNLSAWVSNLVCGLLKPLYISSCG